MRIAMLTYSVKPRGGVVHAVEVAEAMARRGHAVELIALARPGEELFRPARVPVRLVRHEPVEDGFDARIAGMIAAYADGLAPLLGGLLGGHDVVHAQDCLSANAGLILRDAGVIDHVVRTVHHVDDFTSPSLIACQDRSIAGPDHLLCVSPPWVERMAEEYGRRAELVSNGVDTRRFRPPRDARERELDRAAAALGDRFAVLTVAGIEPRKGSLTLLEGFAALRARVPEAVLLIAGGATLFDYRHERERFAARAAELGVGEHVRVLGPQTPAALEALFRAADVFAFPSLKEGFGLVALEALAAGLPLVTSDLDVFRRFLTHGESALLTPAGDARALAAALARVAADPGLRERLRAGGRRVVAAHTWAASAVAHERAYEAFLGARVR